MKNFVNLSILAEIATFNSWLNNDRVTCDEYVDPRDQFSARGACKDCKIKCIPDEEACPGVSQLEAGFYNKTSTKMLSQYVLRAAEMANDIVTERRNNQMVKELAKVSTYQKKIIQHVIFLLVFQLFMRELT